METHLENFHPPGFMWRRVRVGPGGKAGVRAGQRISHAVVCGLSVCPLRDQLVSAPFADCQKTPGVQAGVIVRSVYLRNRPNPARFRQGNGGKFVFRGLPLSTYAERGRGCRPKCVLSKGGCVNIILGISPKCVQDVRRGVKNPGILDPFPSTFVCIFTQPPLVSFNVRFWGTPLPLLSADVLYGRPLAPFTL